MKPLGAKVLATLLWPILPLLLYGVVRVVAPLVGLGDILPLLRGGERANTPIKSRSLPRQLNQPVQQVLEEPHQLVTAPGRAAVRDPPLETL